MCVVVLARKNVAAMKTGARHLLRSVGVLSPSTGTQFFPSAFANVSGIIVIPAFQCILYRVPQLKLYNSRRLFFHLPNIFLMFKIRFHILQIWTFYDLSSFFDLC